MPQEAISRPKTPRATSAPVSILQEPLEAPPARQETPSGFVSRREGKELDELYSAACCALLREVELAHFWDGRPHGPGRAWQLPQDGRLSAEQRLVARVALDVWDNQGGVMLRELRLLDPGMVEMVGELIAATSGPFALRKWVERQLGDDWKHWVVEGRWEQLLGAGWRGILEIGLPGDDSCHVESSTH
jgi:hypothetical protein